MSELVVPYSGELVPLDSPSECARVLNEIRELKKKLREAEQELTFVLTQEFQRQGLKTMELDGVKMELKGGSEIAWDLEVLEELRELGLPEDRFNDLVKAEVSYKVSAREAQRIASTNEQYAEVIERAKQRYAKPQYVTIK